MANPEHLEIFRRGEREWSLWRSANPGIRPDLSGLDFGGPLIPTVQNLADVDLTGCKLERFCIKVCFDRATLDGVVAEAAHFSECTFRDAKGGGIRARSATFDKCDLSGATLSRAGDDPPMSRYGVGLGGNMLVDGTWLHLDSDNNSDFSQSRFFNCTARGVNLSNALLAGIEATACDLQGAVLSGAFGQRVRLWRCCVDESHCRATNFAHAVLHGSTFRGATMDACILAYADLSPLVIGHARNTRIEPGRGVTSVEEHWEETIVTDLGGASLRGARLDCARLVQVNLASAQLDDATVYGVSAWAVDLRGASQRALVITQPPEQRVTVDDLELAQFIYLMLSNTGLRRVVETLTSKVVLLLGRFNDRGLDLLNGIAAVLRQNDYVPVVFDWPATPSRTLTETVELLARMARFVIVDLSEPRSVPHELRAIIPTSPSLVVQPLIIGGDQPYGMFKDFEAYQWVRPTLRAPSVPEVISVLQREGLREIESHRSRLLDALRRPAP